MAHAFQHACKQNQTFQQRQRHWLPDSLHSTDGGGCGGLFFACRRAAGAVFDGISSGVNGG